MSSSHGHVVGMVFCWNIKKLADRMLPPSKATKQFKQVLTKQLFELLEDLSLRSSI